MGFSGLVLYLLSTSVVAGWLMQSLQVDPPIAPVAPIDANAGAIVVLSAGVRRAANEYDEDRIGPLTFERLRYGAELHRRTKLPLLLAGGLPRGLDHSRAELMARSLQKEFGFTPRWLENTSGDTLTNARNTARLLLRENISRVYLVTHSWHMRRAKVAFQLTDLEVIPAPTAFYPARAAYSMVDFIPTARGLNLSAFVAHEYLGTLWYRLTG